MQGFLVIKSIRILTALKVSGSKLCIPGIYCSRSFSFSLSPIVDIRFCSRLRRYWKFKGGSLRVELRCIIVRGSLEGHSTSR